MKKLNSKWSLDRTKYLSGTEIRKLKRAIQDKALADVQCGRTTWPRFSMAINLALSGLRVSEITTVRMGDLYLVTDHPYGAIPGSP